MDVGGVTWAVRLSVGNGVEPTPENSPLHIGDHVRMSVYPARDKNPRAFLVQPDQKDPLSGVVVTARN
jgi:hypothetical protein